jgi:adenine-specific DNA-methyltransferase
MVYELMLKAGYMITDKVVLRQAQGDKRKYYSVNDGELIIALEELNQKIIDSIIAAQPKKVITLDNLFTGNDQLKTNTVLQMKDAGIDFKTI